jgi:hypothetical protein
MSADVRDAHQLAARYLFEGLFAIGPYLLTSFSFVICCPVLCLFFPVVSVFFFFFAKFLH